jgi:hypothetical protein
MGGGVGFINLILVKLKGGCNVMKDFLISY